MPNLFEFNEILDIEVKDVDFSELINQFPDFFMRHYFIVGAWFVVLGMLIVVQIKLMTARVAKATTSSAVTLVNREDGVFVDIRSADMFSKGHIANSVQMSLADIKAGKVNRIENRRDKPVVLVGRDKFDGDCFNSARALKKQGFTKVYIMEGGMLEWANENLPLTTKK